MMNKFFLSIIVLILLSSSVIAQQVQQTDPVFLQKVIEVIITQRDAALNAQAAASARVIIITEENTKLKARVTELEKDSK